MIIWPKAFTAAMKAPVKGRVWPIADEAVSILIDKEQGPKGGIALKAYRCPAGIPTIGLGHIKGVRMGMTCTIEEAWDWFIHELNERTEEVWNACSKVEPNKNQLGALVCLQYNIGQAGLVSSTVMKRHNEGNFQAASRAFALWNKITDPVTKKKVVSNGLTIRRAAESALYLKPDEDDDAEPPERMPQAVQAETSLFKSPISISGATTVGGGVLAGINEATKTETVTVDPIATAQEKISGAAVTVQETKGLIETLGGGIPVDVVLPIVLVGAGLAVLVWRFRQRREGWA